MKKTVLIFTVFVLITICTAFTCTKTNLYQVIVVKDCTGSYLKINGKDYRVCNIEQLEGFANGDIIHAKYRTLKECSGKAVEVPVCMMYHQYEGWIQIIKIG